MIDNFNVTATQDSFLSVVLKYAYAVPLPIPFMMLTVGVGEVISAGVIGLILYEALYKYKTVLFKSIA